MLSNFSVPDSSKRKRKKLTRREIFKKVVTFASAIAFFSMTGSGLVRMYTNALQSGQEAPEETVPSVAGQMSELAARERGYELVLEREPDNSVALEGLATTRIEMGDFEGAIEPLEKLVSMHPNRQDFSDSLNKIRLDLSNSSQ